MSLVSTTSTFVLPTPTRIAQSAQRLGWLIAVQVNGSNGIPFLNAKRQLITRIDKLDRIRIDHSAGHALQNALQRRIVAVRVPLSARGQRFVGIGRRSLRVLADTPDAIDTSRQTLHR
jgi:hypothetical protein